MPQIDRIELSVHFPKNLKEHVLKHEKKHAQYHKKYGLKALPIHILLDYKTCFSLFANSDLSDDLHKFKIKSGKWNKWDKIFQILYSISQTLNPFFMLCGVLVGFARKKKLKQKIWDLIGAALR